MRMCCKVLWATYLIGQSTEYVDEPTNVLTNQRIVDTDTFMNRL
jgi:hypothetical protein